MFNLFNINKKKQPPVIRKIMNLPSDGYKSAFNYSAIGMAFVSLKGEFVEVNHSLANIVGYTKQELIQLTFQDITHPDDLKKDLEYVQKMLDGSLNYYQIEKRYIRKDGSIVPILLFVSFVYNQDGTPKNFLSQIVDMSDIVKLSKDSGEKDNQYKQLFSHMTEAFAHHKIIYDENGKAIDYEYITVNPAFEKMTGLNQVDVIGNRVTKLFPDIINDPADWIGMGSKVAETQDEMTIENYSTGLKKWFKVHFFSPKKGEFVTMFDDISERKKVETQMKEKLVELTKLNDIMTNRELRIAELKDELKITKTS